MTKEPTILTKCILKQVNMKEEERLFIVIRVFNEEYLNEIIQGEII